MVRYLFAFLLLIHGLIHLMGFAKAYKLTVVNQLTATISKPAEFIWLVASLLFLIAVAFFLFNKLEWWIPAVIALIVSQTLIITNWHDAKAGTIANIIVLIVFIVAFANWNFNNQFDKKVSDMLSQNNNLQQEIVTKDMITHLPKPVQTWLLNSGIIGKQKVHEVYLTQNGFMRLKPDDDKWISTMSEQYFTIDKPAFIWKVNMEMMPMVPVVGRDQFIDGKGQMLIKIFSLFNSVNQSDAKINQGALQRYLAEICWFPSAALCPHIRWEAVDGTSAKATMSYKGVSGSVIFYFDKTGNIVRCIADRYKGGGSEATLEKWVVDAKKYATMNGIKIPVKLEVTWKLKEGDYTWCKLEITGIKYKK